MKLSTSVISFLGFIAVAPSVVEAICFTGTANEVAASCKQAYPNNPNLQCCISFDGKNACSWPDDMKVTVCTGACKGEEACGQIAQPTTFEPGSCRGAKACYGLTAKFNEAKKACNEPISVENYSCEGTRACYGAVLVPGPGHEIGYGSCTGTRACEKFVGRVGAHSCVQDGACDGASVEMVYSVEDCVPRLAGASYRPGEGPKKPKRSERPGKSDRGGGGKPRGPKRRGGGRALQVVRYAGANRPSASDRAQALAAKAAKAAAKAAAKTAVKAPAVRAPAKGTRGGVRAASGERCVPEGWRFKIVESLADGFNLKTGKCNYLSPKE
ncbi:expressed unknown protein [Seminavis robusta]|uniref:Uncharacterized protein n=1 Tax=Seminavis robusta TaxID=568900 RepID=A0A9N8DYR0_9STRA|nr:expressed unknown protein [Seminavis robusta]|eukprot:Sro482_g151820.1 n/a (327) ;mRNA; r:31486-32466